MPTLSSVCNFMMGLGKPQLRSKFEVASCSHYRNIIGEPPALGHPIFSSGCDFMVGLGKHKLSTKFEVASFSRCRNIKGEALNFREVP